jgi:hypothetical protein
MNDRTYYPPESRTPPVYRETGGLIERGLNGFVRLKPVCDTCLRVVDGLPGDRHLCEGQRP